MSTDSNGTTIFDQKSFHCNRKIRNNWISTYIWISKQEIRTESDFSTLRIKPVTDVKSTGALQCSPGRIYIYIYPRSPVQLSLVRIKGPRLVVSNNFLWFFFLERC